MKQELTELKAEIVIVGVFSLPLAIIDRTSRKKEELNGTINQLDLTEIHSPYDTLQHQNIQCFQIHIEYSLK